MTAWVSAYCLLRPMMLKHCKAINVPDTDCSSISQPSLSMPSPESRTAACKRVIFVSITSAVLSISTLERSSWKTSSTAADAGLCQPPAHVHTRMHTHSVVHSAWSGRNTRRAAGYSSFSYLARSIFRSMTLQALRR